MEKSFGEFHVSLIESVVYARLEFFGRQPPSGLLQEIDKRFAILVDGAWFSPKYKSGQWDGRIHFFSVYNRRFPAGLTARMVAELKDLGGEVRVRREGVDDLPFKGKILTRLGRYDLEKAPYGYQADVLRTAIAARRGILDLATNAGKTIVAAAIIESLNLPTLYVVGTKDLLFQTGSVFRESLSQTVGLFGGGERSTGTVQVSTAQSLSRLNPRRIRTFLDQFRVLFLDECHHGSATTWYKIGLQADAASYRYGLSGTPFGKQQVRNYRLIGITGPVLSTISNEDLIVRGVSAQPKVWLVPVPPRGAEVPQYPIGKLRRFLADRDLKSTSAWSYSAISDYQIVENPQRHSQIVDLAKKLYFSGRKVLVLSPRRAQAAEIFRLLPKPRYYNHGGVDGRTRIEKLRKYRTGGGIMVATTIYDEGIDIPEVGALLLVGGGKSPRQLLQRIGRSLRRKKSGENSVSIYDFVDVGGNDAYLEEHVRERVRVYLGEGFETEVLRKEEVF